MIEKEDIQTAKIRKGLSARRSVASFQTAQTITIPAGTILRATGDDKYSCKVGFGGVAGEFTVTFKPSDIIPPEAGKRVTAA